MPPRNHLPRSHKGRWRKTLELLVEHGGAMPRAALKTKLESLSESHLSHLLRDLEEAGMITRRRPERSREVLLELLPAGREIVAGHPPDDRPAEGKPAAGDRSDDDRSDPSSWAPWL